MTASKFLVSLLTDAGFQEHPCSEDLVHNSTEIFNAFLKHPKASRSALDWANTVMKKLLAKTSDVQRSYGRVLPEPVAAIEIISLSCLSNASTTRICQRQGL